MIMRYWKPALAALLLLSVAALWWHFLELREVPVKRPTKAMLENPWLAAKLLAEQHRIKVSLPATLDLALAKNRGTLYLPHSDDQLDLPKAKRLWHWVAQGNTVILHPRQSKYEVYPFGSDEVACGYLPFDPASADAVAATATDPIEVKFGVNLWRVGHALPKGYQSGRADAKTRCHASLQSPGQAYPFVIHTRHRVMVARSAAPAPLYQDRDGWAVRVYREGEGHVVLIADNYFSNLQLRELDQAALWLSLLQLPGAHPELAIARNLHALSWHEQVWQAVPLMLAGLALLLLLLFYNGLVRFGALLPAPTSERRALLEHIDASSRWLWHTPGGGQLLLDAMRRQTATTLMRRAPAIARLQGAERVEMLLQATGLARERLDAAFNQPAASRPQPFIMQIQTLQQVRKHYER